MESSSIGAAGRAAAGPLGLGAGIAGSDPEVVAAVVALKDAQQARRDARAQRAEAHHERIALQEGQVAKLRELAGNALWSGVFQAAVGVAASAASVKSGLNDLAAARAEGELGSLAQVRLDSKLAEPLGAGAPVGGPLDPQVEAIKDLRTASAWSNGAGKMLDALARVDPLRIASAGVEREKAAGQVEIERASQRAETASDALAEANRQQGSLIGLLQRVGEARAQGWAAVAR
ncbi:MAG: hypothetical protein IPL40_09390 [Proteobacteria bacterium]|nr:hypothetical protein [Pseudomonadota bacterium]